MSKSRQSSLPMTPGVGGKGVYLKHPELDAVAFSVPSQFEASTESYFSPIKLETRIVFIKVKSRPKVLTSNLREN